MFLRIYIGLKLHWLITNCYMSLSNQYPNTSNEYDWYSTFSFIKKKTLRYTRIWKLVLPTSAYMYQIALLGVHYPYTVLIILQFSTCLSSLFLELIKYKDVLMSFYFHSGPAALGKFGDWWVACHSYWIQQARLRCDEG